MRLFSTVAALGCYLDLVRSHQLSPSSLSPEGLEVSPKFSLVSQGGKEGFSPEEAPPTIGLVPTMGSLHEGHLSLIRQARQENAIAIVSIFVNPLQFGQNEDFHRYPRQLESDRQVCQAAGVDAIFAPSPPEMGVGMGNEKVNRFNANSQSLLTAVVPPATMTSTMCAVSRLGHFQGVATIVTKLLNLVRPTKAYFGEKDFQQLAIIKRLAADLNLPVEIVGCPIVREASGLALSSRNQYLTSEQKQEATVLYRSLCKGKQVFLQSRLRANNASKIKEAVKAELARVSAVEVEYVELVDPDSLLPLESVERAGLLAIAASLPVFPPPGDDKIPQIRSCRLIDNMLLRNRQPIIAIDGPAGAGKSTVTKLVAKELGLLYLDTGAMYRAVTWLVLESGISIDDQPGVAELVAKCQITFTGSLNFQIEINGHEVTKAIRTQEVTSRVSAIAAQPAVRYFMVRQQQEFGIIGGLVAEGRDIGSRVFPDAELKIFLTASVKERSRRRLLELQKQGQENISIEKLEQEISQRDLQDSTRQISPLRKADDAIEIETDGLTITEVTKQIVNLYRQKQI